MLGNQKLYAAARRLFDGAETNHEDEEAELNNNCRGRLYRWSEREIEMQLKLISLRLKVERLELGYAASADDESTELDGGLVVMNRLAVERSSSEPPTIFGNSRIVRLWWRSQLTRPFLWLVLTYLLLRCGSTTFLLYKRDSSLKYWRPKILLGAARSGKCTLASEFQDLGDAALIQTIRWSNGWLDQFGNVFQAMVGAPMMLLQFMGTFIFFLYVTGIVIVKLSNPRVDYLNFAINPHGERARIRLELDKILIKLAKCLTRHANTSSKLNTGRGNSYKGYRVDSAKYLRLLFGSAHLVRPANLTARWHKAVLFMCNGFTPWLIFGEFIGLSVIGIALLLECIVRSIHRLDEMKCQKWMPAGVLIKNTVKLVKLQSQLDLDAYANHDGSLYGLVKLATTVEAKYLITSTKQWIFCLELTIMMICTCIFFFTYQCCWLWCVIDRLKWLRQVEEQLDCCVNLCADRQRIDRPYELTKSSLYELGRLEEVEEEEEEEELEDEYLVKCLTISYLNHRLFNSQQQAFMETASVFITPMVVGNLYMILLSYVVSTQTESLFSRSIFFGLSYFILFTNFYLITAALFLFKAQKMMRNISRLMIMARGGGSSRRIIIDLWRRQLLSTPHLTQLCGFNILGSTISFELLVQVNLYLILMLIISFRSEYKFSYK